MPRKTTIHRSHTLSVISWETRVCKHYQGTMVMEFIQRIAHMNMFKCAWQLRGEIGQQRIKAPQPLSVSHDLSPHTPSVNKWQGRRQHGDIHPISLTYFVITRCRRQRQRLHVSALALHDVKSCKLDSVFMTKKRFCFISRLVSPKKEERYAQHKHGFSRILVTHE